MVKGRPEGLWSSSSAEGKGMKRLVGPARENPEVMTIFGGDGGGGGGDGDEIEDDNDDEVVAEH